MTTPLDNLIAQIESSGGLTSSNVYQQGPGFVSQFGSGAAGVENFANQAISANPGITLGDLYAEYNQGTGTPGSGATLETLAANNAPAYNNFMTNINSAGYLPSTPAADLVSNDGGIAADIAGSVSMGDNPYQTVPTGSAAGAPGASAAPGVWDAIFGNIENLAARFGLVLLGIVLIGVGAWAAAHGEFKS